MTVPQLSDLSGAAGFVLVALWPLLSGRRALLAGQGASAAAFALHYLLIGAMTGAAMAGLVYGGLRERRNSPPGGGFSPVSAKT